MRWIFLIVVLSIYGGMNLYLLLKWRRAFPRTALFTYVLGAFLLVMTFSPVLVRVLDRAGRGAAARALGAVGEPWIVMILWFASLALLLDAWNLLAHALPGAAGDRPDCDRVLSKGGLSLSLRLLAVALRFLISTFNETIGLRPSGSRNAVRRGACIHI